MVSGNLHCIWKLCITDFWENVHPSCDYLLWYEAANDYKDNKIKLNQEFPYPVNIQNNQEKMSNQLSLRQSSPWLVLGCITLLRAMSGTRFSILPLLSCAAQQSNGCFRNWKAIWALAWSCSWSSSSFYKPSNWPYTWISWLWHGQYLFIAHKIPDLSYWQVLLLNVLAGNSSCWIST